MLKTQAFDIAQLLETEADIQEFLNEAEQRGNAVEFNRALKVAACAKKAVAPVRLSPQVNRLSHATTGTNAIGLS